MQDIINSSNPVQFQGHGRATSGSGRLRLAALLAAGLTVALAPIGTLAAGAQAHRHAAPGHASPTPAGFTKYLVYMGESTVAPGEPGLFMDPVNVGVFQQEIMQRTPEEVDQERARAKEFFWQRFGLDFRSTTPDADGVETIDGATLSAFVQNPDANYRAYTISGEAVPAGGWMVRDGGWLVALTSEMLLGGDYGGATGKLVPAGAILVFGDYNIKVTRARSQAPPHADETIVIHYESGFPISANADGVMTFQCALEHPEWGIGRARGVVEGKTIRNVLSFPPELP